LKSKGGRQVVSYNHTGPSLWGQTGDATLFSQ